MKNSRLFIFIRGLILFLIALTSCEQSTGPKFEESFKNVLQATPISGVQITKMEVNQGDDQNQYLTVRLNDGATLEAWCVEWNDTEHFGIENGAKLYSTKGHEAWKELNYFMSIKNDLRANDPDLTFREIQVVIWSIVDNPSFNVDKIDDYENVDPRIYKNGKPLFDVQKVKEITTHIRNHFSSGNGSFDDPGATLIENDGQTLIVGTEAAFAVKTKMVNGQKVVDPEFSECFDKKITDSAAFPNWGWSNGPISESSDDLIFDIYTGAEQCDLNNGTLVGQLTANYNDGTLTVSYRMTGKTDVTGELYRITKTHLHAGSLPYPTNENSGKFTLAPEQYKSQTYHKNTTVFTNQIYGLSGDIYFIAHPVVNGFYFAEEN